MADDRRYSPGDFYRLDDVSGFKIRASNSRKRWDGAIVAPQNWEPRQPQDLVRGVRDDQSVPEPRPRQTDQFVIVGTWVTAYAQAQTKTLTVASTAGFAIGDYCQIMLDTGDPMYSTLTTIGAGTMTFADPFPQTVGRWYDNQQYAPLENTVIKFGVTNGIFILDVTGHDILDVNYLG